MYENPNEYRLYPPENVMFYGVAYYGNLLIDIVKSSELMENGTLMMAASVYHKMLKKGVRKKINQKFNRMSCLSRLGIDVREGMASTVFESQRYPLLLEYYTRLQKQSQRYKLNCNSYVLSCDFRFSPRDIDIPYKIFWMFFRARPGIRAGNARICHRKKFESTAVSVLPSC